MGGALIMSIGMMAKQTIRLNRHKQTRLNTVIFNNDAHLLPSERSSKQFETGFKIPLLLVEGVKKVEICQA